MAKNKDDASRLLFIKNSSLFENVVKIVERNRKKSLSYFSMDDAVDVFCEDHPLKPGRDPVKIIQDSGHKEVLDALVKSYLLRWPDPKKCTVFLEGPSGTGK